MSTSARSPGSAAPEKLTVVFRLVRPRSSEGSVRLGPSTSTSSTRPTRSRFRSPAMRCTRSTSSSSLSCFTSSGTWLGKPGGLRPCPRRVDEGERAVEPHLLDERQRLLEVGVRLAGEPDDEIGAERKVGHRLAERLDESEVTRSVIGSAHRLEDARRPRLRRKMDVLADARTLGERRDDGSAEVLGMRAREADPVDPGDGVARAEELAELGPDVREKIASPGVDVLSEKRDLADAAVSEVRDLRDDLAGPAALLAPSDGRDDAVGTCRIAAHRDLHPGLEASLASDREIGGEVLVGPEATAVDGVAAVRDPVAQMRNRSWAERDVDERIQLEDPLALRFGVAAADGDDDVRLLALPRAGVSEVGRKPRVRLLADRARVEHEDVRLVGVRRLAEPERLEHALDPLRVVSVHLAAERRDVVPPHRGRRVTRAASGPSAAGRRRPGLDRPHVSLLHDTTVRSEPQE